MPALCVPLTTYPYDFDTFLLAHKVNSKWLNENKPSKRQKGRPIECYVCNMYGSHG